MVKLWKKGAAVWTGLGVYGAAAATRVVPSPQEIGSYLVNGASSLLQYIPKGTPNIMPYLASNPYILPIAGAAGLAAATTIDSKYNPVDRAVRRIVRKAADGVEDGTREIKTNEKIWGGFLDLINSDRKGRRVLGRLGAVGYGLVPRLLYVSIIDSFRRPEVNERNYSHSYHALREEILKGVENLNDDIIAGYIKNPESLRMHLIDKYKENADIYWELYQGAREHDRRFKNRPIDWITRNIYTPLARAIDEELAKREAKAGDKEPKEVKPKGKGILGGIWEKITKPVNVNGIYP